MRGLSQQRLQQEIERELARRSHSHFTNFTFPGFRVNWHHALISAALDRFVAGLIKRLMIFEPPRHGKSEQVSRRLPAYILGRYPDAQVIATSYSADLASRMNRDVQRIVDSPRFAEIFPDTRLFGSNVRTVAAGSYLRNSDIFEIVGYRGSYRSAGVGGGITGMGFDYGIIDDPIKNRAEANSPTYRHAVWNWYTSTFYTRQERDASILITLTRWHEDDLAGRLLAQAASDPEADQWTVISLPAIAEDPLADGDPRQLGEALWPWKYNEEKLLKIRKTVGEYEWGALYQQRPKAPEGFRLKREWFSKLVDAAPVEARRVRYWDKAGTSDGGAYTAGVMQAINPDGLIYIEDVVRGQWNATEREKVIVQTAELDAQRFGSKTAVEYYVEQEPGSGGKEFAENTIRNLGGYIVHADRPTGDKLLRLEPFEAQAGAGNVRVVRGTWNAAYIEELCSVPFGQFRDQTDATSGGYNKLATPSGDIDFV